MTNDAVVMQRARIARGGHVIVPGLTLRIPAGGIVGLVGPSGSGKTTVMRAILGLTRLNAGDVTVLGQRAGSPVLRSRIGYMPQGEGVYPDLTGRQNLSFFASIYRVPESDVDTLIEILELSGIADRRVDTYSGGQRQRVGLAIALVHHPPLMILDEPTIGLDPLLRQQLWSRFREWADSGTTLVVSTHVMDEAERCDRVAFMLDGMLAAFGTPRELMERTETATMDDAALRLSERKDMHVG